MSIEWDRYFEQERRLIDSLMPPPTRAETIIEGWRLSREKWPSVATEAGMVVHHDLGIIPSMHFEQIRYGDTLVIECEGVIVERTPIR